MQRVLLAQFHERVKDLIAVTGHGPVLDIGCGEGFAAHALNLSVIGLDHSPSTNPDVLADAHHLPIRDKSVRVALCLEVLEHLQEPWAALEEMRRVSAGYLLLSVPDQPWFSLGNFLRGKNLTRLGEDPEHLWHWRGDTFLRLLAERCEVVRTVRSFPWVIALARV